MPVAGGGAPAGPGRLTFEVQVETPQIILGADGTAVIARCVHAADGRLTGLHYGTYDYSASLGIAAAYQSMQHPAADYARAVMQVAAAGTGVRLSDGSSNVAPEGSRDEVVAAWQLHSRLVRRSLERGFYQGWDLHPAQLASRYAATFAFFREGLPAACERLHDYPDRRAKGLERAGHRPRPGRFRGSRTGLRRRHRRRGHHPLRARPPIPGVPAIARDGLIRLPPTQARQLTADRIGAAGPVPATASKGSGRPGRGAG